MLTLHPAWIQLLIQISLHITPFHKMKTQIKRPLMYLITPNPAHLHFLKPFSIHPLETRNDPLSTPSYISNVTPNYSPLTSERSNNSSPEHTQISYELDNLITLQQQLQHPQTVTIHQLSSNITSSNSSNPTPSTNYTPSLDQTSKSNQSSSSTNRAYTSPFFLNFTYYIKDTNFQNILRNYDPITQMYKFCPLTKRPST